MPTLSATINAASISSYNQEAADLFIKLDEANTGTEILAVLDEIDSIESQPV